MRTINVPPPPTIPQKSKSTHGAEKCAVAILTSTIAWAGLVVVSRATHRSEESLETRLRIVRRLAAPREQVFRAWINADAVRQWFPYRAGVHWRSDPLIDAKFGGRFDWAVISDDNENELFSFHGAYRAFQPPKRLAFTGNGNHCPYRELTDLGILW